MIRNKSKRNTNNGPCSLFIRTIKWVPVIFIVAIVGWSYYAYTVQLCFLYVTNVLERILYLIFYHIVFVLFVWSYWQTVFTQIGMVPEKFCLRSSDIKKLTRAENHETQKMILEIVAKDLPITNRTNTGSVRYCDKCQLIKPDRAHHCSVCGVCVLKMDHHCPWVNNCVNFTNYKFFVLFLGYALVYCIYIALTVLQYFIYFWQGQLEGGMGRFHILFLFFISAMFALSLISLFGYHVYLVMLNRTTLEAFRAPIFRIGGLDKNGYSLGRYNNLQEVFGNNLRLWFIPVFTSLGDGVQYPVQSQHETLTYDSMATTPSRFDDTIIDIDSVNLNKLPCETKSKAESLDGTSTPILANISNDSHIDKSNGSFVDVDIVTGRWAIKGNSNIENV